MNIKTIIRIALLSYYFLMISYINYSSNILYKYIIIIEIIILINLYINRYLNKISLY